MLYGIQVDSQFRVLTQSKRRERDISVYSRNKLNKKRRSCILWDLGWRAGLGCRRSPFPRALCLRPRPISKHLRCLSDIRLIFRISRSISSLLTLSRVCVGGALFRRLHARERALAAGRQTTPLVITRSQPLASHHDTPHAFTYVCAALPSAAGQSSTFSACLLAWCRAPDSPTCSLSCSASSWCPGLG